MTIVIPCPQCGRDLRLPDPRMLGRKGKCPQCGHAFVLEDTSNSSKTSATRDEQAKPIVVPAAQPQTTTSSTDPGNAFPFSFPNFEQDGVPTGTAARLRKQQQQQVRHRKLGLIIGGLAVAVVVLVALFRFAILGSSSARVAPKDAPQTAPHSQESVVGEGDAGGPLEDDGFDPKRTEYAQLGSPTQGLPIDLRYIPFGTQVIVNLHPAAMWQDRHLTELRQAIPPLAQLIETTIEQLFHCPPTDIDELLLCLIPLERGSMPRLAAVARMQNDLDPGDLVSRLKLRRDTQHDSVYVGGQRAYWIVEPRTLAVCPEDQLVEMLSAAEQGHPLDQIDPLRPQTDRQRQFTVIFSPQTLSLHDAWFSEPFRPLLSSSLGWLGTDVESLGYSLHVNDDLCLSELMIRAKPLKAKRLPTDMSGKLKGLAGVLVPLIQQMKPKEQGKRRVIGRFPAMIEVYSMATIFQVAPRQLLLTTPLPPRAATNLLLASYLVSDEATRTDFSQARPTPSDARKLPAALTARLEIPIDVDFRATPLSEAFSYISSEIGTPIELDGDALKSGGFTKNLKQTFKLDATPVKAVIARIFVESRSVEGNPEKRLVVVGEESPQRLLITTMAFTRKRGLSVLNLE